MPEAQFRLAAMYNSGEGLPRDMGKAFKWFRRAALLGHSDSQCQIAAMYLAGQGVHQDKASASRLFRMAAETTQQRSITLPAFICSGW
jgi:TPR repeat protein